jgi:hypothetical protein
MLKRQQAVKLLKPAVALHVCGLNHMWFCKLNHSTVWHELKRAAQPNM